MRTRLRPRQVQEILAPGADRLRFVVVRDIPTGGEPLRAGADVTDLVRSGAIPADVAATHVKRGSMIAKPEDGRANRAGVELLRKLRKNAPKATVRKALEAAGIPVPPFTTTAQLHALVRATLAEAAA